jgi:DNA topoisomerase-1
MATRKKKAAPAEGAAADDGRGVPRKGARAAKAAPPPDDGAAAAAPAKPARGRRKVAAKAGDGAGVVAEAAAAPRKARRAAPFKGTGPNLVIVESPAKAKTIHKYLGKDFVVKASMGHVRDLPGSVFGFDPEKGFEATYQIIPSKKKVVADLRKAAAKAPLVYLATDLDREGEAIAWHLAEALEVGVDRQARVTFNEITKRAITEAFQNPRKIDQDKVDAQQARRFLDRMMGYKLSPLLWRRAGPGTSAGRVQSVALRLIVEREREIRAFKSEPYWTVEARFAKEGSPPTPPAPEPDPGEDAGPPPLAAGEFLATLAAVDGKKADLREEAAGAAVLARAKGARWSVGEVRRDRKEDRAPPPFTTSTLQQQAAIRMRFSAKKTMSIAQRLYQGVELGDEGQVALITYMRTDSVNLSDDAVREGRAVIGKQFGERYLPEAPNRFRAGARAQEAHEAVRPTDPARTPESVSGLLDRDEARLYDLIWRRFMACQMKPSIADHTTVRVSASGLDFEAKGRTPVFDGWRRAWPSKEKDEPELPDLAKGEPVEDRGILSQRHDTQPPPRFSEATLVKTLEKEGIGRPSTYAAIISTIVDRTYVNKDKGRFRPTGLGEVVTDLLVPFFDDLLNTSYTSKMEARLDQVEAKEVRWTKVLEDFWKVFKKDLKRAEKEMKPLKHLPAPEGTPPCDKCGREMVRKLWKGSEFLGCSGYPECKNTRKVGADGTVLPPPEPTEHKCEKCGKEMVIRMGRRGKFLACTGYPQCRNARDVAEDGSVLPALPSTDQKCEKCGSDMAVKRGRRGPFLACTGYPKCRNAKDLDAATAAAAGLEAPAAPEMPPGPPPEPCEKCGSAMVVKRGRRGPFLACSGYPKCKNARDLPGQARKAPEPAGIECPDCGKPMVVRFSRRGPFAGCTGYPSCRKALPMPGR